MTIGWTPLAISHLESPHAYVAHDNPTAADDLVERILSAVDLLERQPRIGRDGRVSGTRELVITGTPFIVAYRVHRKRIEVLAVLHGARRWPDEL